LYLYCVIQTFHPFDIKKSSIREKNTSKEYLDLGEEEKIRKKNKNLYFYCVLETYPFARKHIFREKKHKKKYSNLEEEEKIGEKNKSFYLYYVPQ